MKIQVQYALPWFKWKAVLQSSILILPNHETRFFYFLYRRSNSSLPYWLPALHTVKVMKSLQEMCANAILQSDMEEWVWSMDVLERCACDYYENYYMMAYNTEEFIWLLPLPEALKKFIFEVSKKNCVVHHNRVFYSSFAHHELKGKKPQTSKTKT